MNSPIGDYKTIDRLKTELGATGISPAQLVDVTGKSAAGNGFNYTIKPERGQEGRYNVNNGAVAVVARDSNGDLREAVLPIQDGVYNALENAGFVRDGKLAVPFSNGDGAVDQQTNALLTAARLHAKSKNASRGCF